MSLVLEHRAHEDQHGRWLRGVVFHDDFDRSAWFIVLEEAAELHRVLIANQNFLARNAAGAFGAVGYGMLDHNGFPACVVENIVPHNGVPGLNRIDIGDVSPCDLWGFAFLGKVGLGLHWWFLFCRSAGNDHHCHDYQD